MSDIWIEYNLTNQFSLSTARDILKNGYESVLVGVSKDKIVLQSLNKKAKKITENITLAK